MKELGLLIAGAIVGSTVTFLFDVLREGRGLRAARRNQVLAQRRVVLDHLLKLQQMAGAPPAEKREAIHEVQRQMSHLLSMLDAQGGTRASSWLAAISMAWLDPAESKLADEMHADYVMHVEDPPWTNRPIRNRLRSLVSR